MSVIPFVFEGDNRNITNNIDEFVLSEKKLYLTYELENTKINNRKDSNISYNLRVGKEYRDHRETGKTDIKIDDTFTLHPGNAIVIQTEEYFNFPKTYFGQILPKVSLLHEGVSNTTSKVDPGFKGYLYITIFNLGKKPRIFKRGDEFCSLILHDVGEGVTAYDKPPPNLPGKDKLKKMAKLHDFIDRNGVSLSVLLSIISILLVIFHAILAILNLI
ncbi:dCTP deaminase domain-containing protein [Jeotgalibacillus haloalkalitolerans]|uniref:dUTPase-like domain-containing protein n=1 Tax=Jeotgalibacillus haloalkalitolerans TaxID=3104292 RepID=A0ABU5KMD1_9BACL|nr:hypothetical protein [Jeotgalibacillus sp. HH7-29]MDZ5712422.1 hypothetical protein [Jeotgalibacillus sp. HH7-29]